MRSEGCPTPTTSPTGNATSWTGSPRPPRLHRACLLKDGLRYVFIAQGEAGKIALDRWLSWARRCRIPPFVHLAKRITAVRDKIHAALEHSLSNVKQCAAMPDSGSSAPSETSVIAALPPTVRDRGRSARGSVRSEAHLRSENDHRRSPNNPWVSGARRPRRGHDAHVDVRPDHL